MKKKMIRNFIRILTINRKTNTFSFDYVRGMIDMMEAGSIKVYGFSENAFDDMFIIDGKFYKWNAAIMNYEETDSWI